MEQSLLWSAKDAYGLDAVQQDGVVDVRFDGGRRSRAQDVLEPMPSVRRLGSTEKRVRCASMNVASGEPELLKAEAPPHLPR